MTPVLKVEFLVTRRCQLSCDYCLITDSRTLRGPEMALHKIFGMIELIADQWPGAPLIIFGGEPTTRKDLPEMIQFCRKLDVKAVVISNGLQVVRSKAYRERLLSAGLENWSCSFDGFGKDEVLDDSIRTKSTVGFESLRLMRDEGGIRDLVTCITVTDRNIEKLPEIIARLTMEGIWAICTPLQIGHHNYEYSAGRTEHLPLQDKIDRIAPILKEMAISGQYLMHNFPEWFDTWSASFRSQSWKCQDKAVLTVDSDGSLRYCVDIPFRPEDAMDVMELHTRTGREHYDSIIEKGPGCQGCLWDPAYESLLRSSTISPEAGRRSYRHEIDSERLSRLEPAARHWFIGNPLLKPIREL